MNDPILFDPKGLIHEAFVIPNITAPECRSIFLDWALGLPADYDPRREVSKLLAHYRPLHSARHPMLETLKAALQECGPARRRGGRKGRLSTP